MPFTITNATPADEASVALALTYLNTSTEAADIMQQASRQEYYHNYQSYTE
jgi:hypothetical protein